MKNATINSAKKTATNNVATEKKIVNLNLDKFAQKLSEVKLTEKKDKATLYFYPENLSKADINGEQGKKFRNSLRNKIQKFANNITVFASMQQKNKKDETVILKLKNEVKAFNIFYKENYQINDFSIKSISASNNDGKTANIELMLDIVKTVNAL